MSGNWNRSFEPPQNGLAKLRAALNARDFSDRREWRWAGALAVTMGVAVTLAWWPHSDRAQAQAQALLARPPGQEALVEIPVAEPGVRFYWTF